MPKYKDGNFVQINRDIFKAEYHHNSILIYVVLSELEHRFTGKKENFFFRSLTDLAKDCRMNRTTVIKYRKPLIDDKWLQTWQMHWINPETQKKSEKKITAYRVLR